MAWPLEPVTCVAQFQEELPEMVNEETTSSFVWMASKYDHFVCMQEAGLTPNGNRKVV